MASSISYWNGSSWVSVNISHFSYWNGSAWTAPTDVKYWSGSAWITVFGGTGVSGSNMFRTSATNTSNSASSIGVTIPSSVQTGDLLVLAVAQTSNATTLFNAISGWTKQGEQRAGTSAHTIAVYTRLAQAGDASSTVTATSVNTATITAHVRAYSGVNQTTPLDTTVAFAQVDPAATSGGAPAVTVATTGAAIVTIYSVPTTANTTLSSSDWTDPTGFGHEVTTCPNSSSNNAALATYDETTPGTGSQGTFSATITQSRRWAMATVVIRPA